MASLDYKGALLLVAVLVGPLAWHAVAPLGGEVGPGRSGTKRSFWEESSICRRNRLIYLARGPPDSRSRVDAVWNQAQQVPLQGS